VPAELAAAISGVGISAPGPLDPWAGVIVDTPNLGPGFREVAIADPIERALDLPTYIDRDTNVAALGEQHFGAAQGVSDFLYITISTGFGGAIVSGGEILHGPDGTAGELGHLPIEMDGPICGCGHRGHVEAFLSGAALARHARASVESGESPFLAARAGELGGASALDARDVAEGEDAGDGTCVALMERARRAFAFACVGFVNVFNPARIVVGGAIAAAQGERLLAPARDEVRRFAFRLPAERVSIVAAGLGDDVGLAGAVPLVAARLGNPAWRRDQVVSARHHMARQNPALGAAPTRG
jgi:glucokinase